MSRGAALAVEAVRFAIGLNHLVNARSAAEPSRPSPANGLRPVVVTNQEVVRRRDPVTVGFLRILGLRQMVQAVLLVRNGSGNAHTLGAVVDATHAATMVPFALVSPGRIRLFASQFGIAIAFAVAEILLVGRGGRR